jgi:hypothetical protein
MKKNDVLLIIGTFLFSFLFYEQGAGLNVFLFSLSVPVLLAVYKPESLKNRLWLFGAFLTILTGFSVFVNGTVLSVFAFYFAVTYLAGVTASTMASPAAAIAYSTFSCMTSVGYMIGDSIERKKIREEKIKRKINRGAIIAMGLFIFVVVAIFFFLYQDANPLFKEITKFINLDFISLKWVLFTFLGFLLIYGIIYTLKIRSWDEYEKTGPRNIDREKAEAGINRFLWFEMDTDIERKAGVILFVLLNIMILTINVLDISFLWTGMELPDGFTFAGYLHKGIYTLIFSCVLAILLILLIFRGRLNFTDNNKTLKIMAYTWIIQNIFIAVSCALKNSIYISSYALTYRRITIFVLLILLLVGLISAIIKIMKKRNIYYLFRLNSFSFLIVFAGISLFNWDGIITKYNLKNSEFPDVAYLVDLNDSGLPYLLHYAETTPAGEKTVNTNYRSRSFYTPESFYWQRPLLTDIIYDKTYRLLYKHKHTSWKSYNLNDAMTIRKIRTLYDDGILKQFVINGKPDFDIHILTEFNGLQSLSITNSVINDTAGIECLKPFTKLESLKLSEMNLENIDKLPEFSELKKINLSNNSIIEFGKLIEYQTLTDIDISSNPTSDISFLSQLQNIETLNLSYTGVTDLSVLSELRYLKKLYLRSMQNTDFSTLPICPSLEEIDLSENVNLSKYKNLAALISGASHLSTVLLQNISLSSLAYFSDTILVMNKYEIPGQSNINPTVLAHIGFLDVSSNPMVNLSGIQAFKGLSVLHAQSNSITGIKHIRNNTNLIELDLRMNPITSLKGIESLKNLKYAHFSEFTFSEISELQNLENLEALSLNNGFISDMLPITKLKKLKYLDLSYTNIPSLDFVEEMENLEFLNLSGYTGSDIEKIIHCKNLKIIILPRIQMRFKRKLEQEIPQIRIIRDYEFEDWDFYMTKYGKMSE